MPRPGRANLILRAVSTTFTLLVFEVMARLYLAAPLSWRFPQIRYQRDPRLIAFGYGVEESESVGARLAARLADRGLRAEVINTGVQSYNVE